MKKMGGLIYSTDSNLNLSPSNEVNDNTSKSEFTLYVCFEKKGRAGKGVTIIKGFLGNKDILEQLSKKIKQSLGIGGSIKNQEIILQGRIQEKIIELLKKDGYKSKKVGG